MLLIISGGLVNKDAGLLNKSRVQFSQRSLVMLRGNPNVSKLKNFCSVTNCNPAASQPKREKGLIEGK